MKPDIHVTFVKGEATLVTFITDIDSISFNVKPGENYDFAVLYGNDTALTQIQGKRFIKRAHFSDDYIRRHNGKTHTEIPEVYELVNILIALAPEFNKKNPWVTEKKNEYYNKVMEHFSAWQNDPFIQKADSLLTNNSHMYTAWKMDAYAFEFNKRSKIVKGKVYDRISGNSFNTWDYYLDRLQTFADKTNFRKFYKKHRSFFFPDESPPQRLAIRECYRGTRRTQK